MTRPVTREVRIRIGVINIPVKVRRPAWKKCFTLLLERVDIGGVNESFTPAQRQLYRKVAEAEGFAWSGSTGPNPIFWDATMFNLVSGRRIPIHPAGTGRRARRFPGYNGAREINEVVLELIAHPGTEIAVLNTHFVPEGPQVPSAWRNQMRSKSKTMLGNLAAAHVARGRVVFPIGDTNIHEPFSVAPVRWLRGKGVDKIGIALPSGVRGIDFPAEARVIAQRVGWFLAPTDHRRGFVANVRLAITRRRTR